MMTDTRTPADLGHKPSPTRAERDTWIPLETVTARRERVITERIAAEIAAMCAICRHKETDGGRYCAECHRVYRPSAAAHTA